MLHTQQKHSFGQASGKIILFGEHSVVFGKPAIAIPLQNLYVITNIEKLNNDVIICSNEIGLNSSLSTLSMKDPIRQTIQIFSEEFSIPISNIKINIKSTIPVASGLGSGAAVSISILKALNNYYSTNASLDCINQIAFEIEKIHHGTPSGIDNTTITFEKPIFFQKNKSVEILDFKNTYHFIVANSGIKASTKEVVTGVRERYLKNQDVYSDFFNKMGIICKRAKKAFEYGDFKLIGELMTENQYYLEKIDVSSLFISNLISSGQTAGASGVKLSGAGIGGNVIALVDEDKIDAVKTAFLENGATHVFSTCLKENK